MPEKKDNWDKAQVILEPVGGLLTAFAVAALGFFGSRFLESRQTEETNARLYTELTSKREESESKLRTDMFNSIIGTFLKEDSSSAKKENFDTRILNMELLCYNFHDAIDIGPLFKHLDQQITEAKIENNLKQKYLERLRRIANDVIRKQVAVLEQYGIKRDGVISFENLDNDTLVNDMINPTNLEILSKDIIGKNLPSKCQREISLDVIKYDSQTQELHVRLIVKVNSTNGQQLDETCEFTSKDFWVGFYDFPMIDNTRLSDGYRCAIVLNDFDKEIGSADITLIYFPGEYASLKERPFYEELIQNLKQTRKKSKEN